MTASEPKLPDDFSDVEEVGRDTGRLRVTLEILAAILVLVGIYYLFAPAEEPALPPLERQEIDPIIRAQIDAQADQPVQPDNPTDASDSAPTALAGAETPPSERPVTPPRPDGEAAREIIAARRSGNSGRPLSEIDSQAREFQRQGHITDAYLLWFYAARQGDGEAAFALANLYDPNHFKPGVSPLTDADATQAYKWYSAAAASVPEAGTRLQALRASLQARADTGDVAAQRLLLNWQ